MELDLRGLSVEQRKKLLMWYLLNAPLLGWRGNLKAFKYLKKIEGKENEEFVRRAICSLFDDVDEDDEDDDEEGAITLPERKQILGHR